MIWIVVILAWMLINSAIAFFLKANDDEGSLAHTGLLGYLMFCVLGIPGILLLAIIAGVVDPKKD